MRPLCFNQIKFSLKHKGRTPSEGVRPVCFNKVLVETKGPHHLRDATVRSLCVWNHTTQGTAAGRATAVAGRASAAAHGAAVLALAIAPGDRTASKGHMCLAALARDTANFGALGPAWAAEGVWAARHTAWDSRPVLSKVVHTARCQPVWRAHLCGLGLGDGDRAREAGRPGSMGGHTGGCRRRWEGGGLGSSTLQGGGERLPRTC